MAVFKLLQSGRCSCGAGAASESCTCVRDDRYTFSFRFRGRQYTRRTDATVKAKALEIERAFLRGLQGERCDEVLAFLNSDQSRMRRVCASLGEVKAAYRGKWNVWLSSQTAAMRNLTSLDLVVAYGLDLWTTNSGGKKGIKKGARVADTERIDKLSAGVLTAKLVEAHYLARQQATGITEGEEVVQHADELHAGFNSTLKQARDVFSESARLYALKDLSLPDLTGFLKAPKLAEDEREPEPFGMPEWAALCAAFDALRESDPDLWLLNVISRQTGMRPKYVMALRGSWLVEGEEGQGFIDVKSRPDEGFNKKRSKNGTTRSQLVPVSALVRDEIQRRGAGVTIAPGLTKSGRVELQKRHNALIKKTVGDEGSHGQGAYRYRDTVASVLGFLYGLDAAQRALGHTTSLTTLKHYTRDLPGVSALMREELAAWLNLPSLRRGRE